MKIPRNMRLEELVNVTKANLYYNVVKGHLTSEKNQEIQKEIDNYMNSNEKNKTLLVVQSIIDKHIAKQE